MTWETIIAIPLVIIVVVMMRKMLYTRAEATYEMLKTKALIENRPIKEVADEFLEKGVKK